MRRSIEASVGFVVGASLLIAACGDSRNDASISPPNLGDSEPVGTETPFVTDEEWARANSIRSIVVVSVRDAFAAVQNIAAAYNNLNWQVTDYLATEEGFQQFINSQTPTPYVTLPPETPIVIEPKTFDKKTFQMTRVTIDSVGFDQEISQANVVPIDETPDPEDRTWEIYDDGRVWSPSGEGVFSFKVEVGYGHIQVRGVVQPMSQLTNVTIEDQIYVEGQDANGIQNDRTYEIKQLVLANREDLHKLYADQNYMTNTLVLFTSAKPDVAYNQNGTTWLLSVDQVLQKEGLIIAEKTDISDPNQYIYLVAISLEVD